MTNSDGRASGFVTSNFTTGVYKFRFETAEYFEGNQDTFYPYIEVRYRTFDTDKASHELFSPSDHL